MIYILVINQLDAQIFCFTLSLFHASTCFEHHVLIVRRSELYYTASDIIKPIGVMIPDLYMFRAPCAHRQEVRIVLYSIWYHHTYRCDDTRSLHVSSTMCSSSGGQNCILQHLVSSHL